MSGTPYLSGEQILDAHNAHGMGVSLEFIAGQFGVTVQQLRAAMGLPQWRDTPASSTDNEPDLFSGFDRLQEQL